MYLIDPNATIFSKVVCFFSFGSCPRLGMRWLQFETCICPFLRDSVYMSAVGGKVSKKMCFDRRTGVATTIYLPLIIEKQRMADFLVLCGLFSAMYAIFNHFNHFSSRSWGCSIRLNNTRQSDRLVSRWGSMTEKHMSYVHLEYRRSHMLQPNKSFHNVVSISFSCLM